jgi:hypothetical protein
MMQRCFFCQQEIVPVHVHGHYQCPVCHTNMMPCCDGDNCDTNLLLQNNSVGSADRVAGRLEE